MSKEYFFAGHLPYETAQVDIIDTSLVLRETLLSIIH